MSKLGSGELGECSGGYQTLEREVAALRAEVERLRQEHHLMLGALADIGFCEGGDVDIDRFRQKARRIYNATSKA